MTISTALKALSGVMIVLTFAAAAVTTTSAPAEAKPVVRDHRTTPKWTPGMGKGKARPVVRDHRTTPKWQPTSKKKK